MTDRSLIRQFLMTDRFFADYALGDLDPVHFQQTEWWGVENNGELCSLMMIYHDLTPPILFALGETRGTELLLDQVVQLPEIGLSIREEQLPIVEKFYRAKPYPMLKMALLQEDFRPVAPNHSAEARMVRLEASHIPQLYDLYAYGGGDAFRPKSLEFGVFYGVFVADRLVAIAGTHIVSDDERVAALGNVMTHPQYRDQGLATRATNAVCDELLGRGIQLIGLSVGRSNVAAIRVYEKIGFKRRVPFYEGTAVRI